MLSEPTSRRRLGLLILLAVGVVLIVVWRGPGFTAAADALAGLEWQFVVLCYLLNCASVTLRAASWDAILAQGLPRPRLRRRNVFTAFSIGVVANALLPARPGELARIGVVTTHLRHGPGAWATVAGTTVAHRLLDVVWYVGLVVFVIAAARIPAWAVTTVAATSILGVVLLALAVALARRRRPTFAGETEGRVRALLSRALDGLAVFRSPAPAVQAGVLQCLGWTAELLAIVAMLEAFGLDVPFVAAAVVLLATNLATLFPFWPGNIGLFQATVALPLVAYGVPYANGLLFAAGLQAVEISVALSLGLPSLAYEGVSFASLRERRLGAPPAAGGIET